MLPRLEIAPAAPSARPPAEASRVAVTGLVVVAAAAALRALGPSRGDLAAMADPASWASSAGVDGALAQAAGLGAWACLLWLTVGLGLVVAARAPGIAGRVADRVAAALLPAAIRRVLEAALGVALVAGSVGGPAVAAAAQSPSRSAVPVPTAAGVGPLERPVAAVPSAATTGSAPGSATTPAATPVPYPTPTPSPSPTTIVVPPLETPVDLTAAPTAPAPVVVVAPGDCLWDIAADYLGDSPTDADVDRSWRRWYAANRDVVGAEPDLIHPGQRLVPPPDAGTPTARDAGGPS